MKNLNEIQENIKKLCVDYNMIATNEIRIMDLVSEVGELSKEIIKSTDYGKKEFIITENTESEIGDVFFALITIANQLNISLEKALDKVIIKYKKRFEINNSFGSKKE